MRTEPVALAAAVRAVLLAVMAFGFDLTGEQVAAVAIAVETVAALFVRSKVYPAANVVDLEEFEFTDAVSTYGFQPPCDHDCGCE